MIAFDADADGDHRTEHRVRAAGAGAVDLRWGLPWVS